MERCGGLPVSTEGSGETKRPEFGMPTCDSLQSHRVGQEKQQKHC